MVSEPHYVIGDKLKEVTDQTQQIIHGAKEIKPAKALKDIFFSFLVWTLHDSVKTPKWVVYLPSISYSIYVLTLFVRVLLIFIEDFK